MPAVLKRLYALIRRLDLLFDERRNGTLEEIRRCLKRFANNLIRTASSITMFLSVFSFANHWRNENQMIEPRIEKGTVMCKQLLRRPSRSGRTTIIA